MPLRLLPDVEALLVAYLRAHASVTAQVGARTYTQVPPNPVFPLVTLSLATGAEVVPNHLDEAIVDAMAWSDKPDASLPDQKALAGLVIRTVRAALLEAPSASHSRGVVTRVRTLVAPRWLPDDTTVALSGGGTSRSSRPRYHAQMGVTVHPHPL